MEEGWGALYIHILKVCGSASHKAPIHLQTNTFYVGELDLVTSARVSPLTPLVIVLSCLCIPSCHLRGKHPYEGNEALGSWKTCTYKQVELSCLGHPP